MTEPIYVDNSTLSAVARCSTEALVRYGLGYTTIEEHAALLSGSAGHEALAVWFRGGAKADALATLEKHYREWAEANVAADDRLGWPNVHAVLDAWIDRHPLSGFPFTVTPDFVEVGYAVPLDASGEFIFTGRIDLICHSTTDDTWWVLDHKFTGRVDAGWAKQFRMASQLKGYLWAAQQHTDLPVIGAYVNAVELSRLPSDPKRRCKQHGVTYAECGPQHLKAQLFAHTYTPEQVGEWRKTALHLARRYRDLITRYGGFEQLHKVRTQGMFNGHCRFCSLFNFCGAGRQPSLVKSMLMESKWDPLRVVTQPALTSGHKP